MPAVNPKHAIKRAGLSLASAVGQHLPSRTMRRFLCDRVVPLLLDESVIERGLVEREQRHSKVTVLCDPHEQVHRNGFFCGRFHQEEVELFLLREIHPGDSLIDVGMNVGHVALPAAKLAGPTGRVVAFEPQADLAQRVRELAQKQDLGALLVHACGLADIEGELLLAMRPDIGAATFRSETTAATRKQGVRCTVRIGDEVLARQNLPGRVGLKVDAEGFELSVLRGLRRTLRERVEYALVEVTPRWLGAAGIYELFAMMDEAGLEPRALEADGSARRVLMAKEIQSPTKVAFIRVIRRGQAAKASRGNKGPVVAA